MKIRKRDGSLEELKVERIVEAINRACESVCKDDIDWTPNVSLLGDTEVVDVERIDRFAVEELMRHGMYDVATSFIIYMNEHKEDRETVNDINFLKNYVRAKNASDGSKFDANSNVTSKNISTLMGEIPKKKFIRINRKMLTDRIKEMYGKETADEYTYLLDHHFIYKNDETSIANYCASITMYPWLLNGTTGLGGIATAPTNLKSFCGGFINMVFIVSSMLSGACATPEFLMYMNYFIEKEYGKDWATHLDDVVDLSLKKRTLRKVLTDCFEQIVYSLNQPTGARNFQAVFWNISYYDSYYFDSIFGNFIFPDGSKPTWENVSALQKFFMKWLNTERTKAILTFPVETMAMLTDGEKPKDDEWYDFASEMYSEGHSFFTYLSESADSLSSCCRLRNEIKDNEFSYTLGAGGVSTGSKSVLTINLNRVWQEDVRRGGRPLEFLEHVVDICHKVQCAYDANLRELMDGGLLPLFTCGYININRQYLTIGINGLVESAEFEGLTINDNPWYLEHVQGILALIERYNKMYSKDGRMFNCEMIPAENVGVKHAKWDKEDGYAVPRECYNSYFYKVEDRSLNIFDKLRLHGREYIQYLTGGSALHLNLEEHLSKEQYKKILSSATHYGCNYLTFNIPNTVCNDCGHIDKRYLHKCPKCGSENIDFLTRVIGYIRRISNFSSARQREAQRRFYHKA